MAISLSEKLLIGQINRALEKNLQAEIVRQFNRINRDLTQGIASAYASGTVGATNGVKAFAIGIKNNFADPKDLERIHSDVAAEMRESVRRSFGQSVKSKPGHYRIGGEGDKKRRTSGGFLSRYSGGSLKRAVGAPSLATGDAHGISFIDEGRLTREAAHWARLNFGAKGYSVGGRKKTSYRFVFDERVVGSIGFNVDSRPPFQIPPGRWFTPEGKRVAASSSRKGMDQFFLARKQRNIPEAYNMKTQRFIQKKRGLDKKPTSGIRPREFFDAGLRTMTRELPIRYEGLLDKWYRDSKRATKLPDRVLVRPRR